MMEATAETRSLSRSKAVRTLRRRESPQLVVKTRSFDERCALGRPTSTFHRRSPPSSSSTTSVSSNEEDSVVQYFQSNDIMNVSSPSQEMKLNSAVRKRPSPRSPTDDASFRFGDIATPRRASPNHSPNGSNTLRRKKRSPQRRKGFYYLLKQRQQWTRAVVIVMSMLFLASFCFSFFGVRSLARSMHPSWRRWTRSNGSKDPVAAPPNPPALRQTKTKSSWTHVLSPKLNRQPGPTRMTPANALRGSSSTSITTKTSKTSPFQQYTLTAPQCKADMAIHDVDFTVATQLSLNRLWMLEHHCARWTHAISLAVYIGNDTTTTVESIADELLHMGCGASSDLRALHIQTLAGYSEEEYPVNVLRNMALAAVTTSHVVYVDIDFWESIDLYDTLHQHQSVLASNPKLALVVPAFQLSRQCREWRDCRETNIPKMPHVKEELVDLMVEHQANAFDPSNRGGHGSTRYKDWLIQEPEDLIPIECVKSNRYEPYLVFRKCYDLPPFQEAFTGYGKNKMTWMMQLRRTGYQFMQLGSAFVVHYPHLDSTARMHWNGGQDGAQLRKPRDPSVDLSTFKRGQIDATFVAFREWLWKEIPDQAIAPMCEDALDDDERLWIAPQEKTQQRRRR
jgi:Glycosyl-transferase for dystroglycan